MDCAFSWTILLICLWMGLVAAPLVFVNILPPSLLFQPGLCSSFLPRMSCDGVSRAGEMLGALGSTQVLRGCWPNLWAH